MKFVISTDFLQLLVGIHQWMPVPQAYVIDGCLVGLERLEGKVLFAGEGFRCNLMKVVRQLGQRDVALDVGLLQLQLIWFDEHAIEECWNHAGKHKGSAENEYYRCHGNLEGAALDVCPCGQRSNDRKADQQPKHGQFDMDVGVARAHDYAIIAVEQQITVETIGPGLHSEKEPEQRRAVAYCCGRYRPTLSGIFDVAVHPINRPSEERAQNEREKHPIFDCDISRQRKEIETNILVIKWVACAIGHLIEEPKEDAPIVDLSPGDKDGE